MRNLFWWAFDRKNHVDIIEIESSVQPFSEIPKRLPKPSLKAWLITRPRKQKTPHPGGFRGVYAERHA
jgi:hypothetical protein